VLASPSSWIVAVAMREHLENVDCFWKLFSPASNAEPHHDPQLRGEHKTDGARYPCLRAH